MEITSIQQRIIDIVKERLESGDVFEEIMEFAEDHSEAFTSYYKTVVDKSGLQSWLNDNAGDEDLSVDISSCSSYYFIDESGRRVDISDFDDDMSVFDLDYIAKNIDRDYIFPDWEATVYEDVLYKYFEEWFDVAGISEEKAIEALKKLDAYENLPFDEDYEYTCHRLGELLESDCVDAILAYFRDSVEDFEEPAYFEETVVMGVNKYLTIDDMVDMVNGDDTEWYATKINDACGIFADWLKKEDKPNLEEREVVDIKDEMLLAPTVLALRDSILLRIESEFVGGKQIPINLALGKDGKEVGGYDLTKYKVCVGSNSETGLVLRLTGEGTDVVDIRLGDYSLIGLEELLTIFLAMC